MGQHTGCASRFTLSYDFVFLAAVRCAVLGITPKALLSRCMIHPVKLRPMISDNEALSYSASAAAVLMRAKVLDDVNDKTSFSRVGAKLLLPAAGRMEKRALSSCDIVPADEIYSHLEVLSRLEKENCTSLDTVSSVFGELLGCVFASGLSGNAEKIARVLGESTGKFIYVIDAADDLEKDKKEKNYNPLLLCPASPDELSCAMRLELSKMDRVISLLDTSASIEISELIKNIIYEGMPNAVDAVFKKCGTTSTKGRKGL